MSAPSFNSSTTNISTSTVVTSTTKDLGKVFCFSVSCPNTTPAVVPSGEQYVPGTICTIYSTAGTSIGNPGIINGNGGDVGSLGANQAAVFVSVYFDGTYTHWVQVYRGSA